MDATSSDHTGDIETDPTPPPTTTPSSTSPDDPSPAHRHKAIESAIQTILQDIPGEDAHRPDLLLTPTRAAHALQALTQGYTTRPPTTVFPLSGPAPSAAPLPLGPAARHPAPLPLRTPPAPLPRPMARRVHPEPGRRRPRPVQVRAPARRLRAPAAGAGAADAPGGRGDRRAVAARGRHGRHGVRASVHGHARGAERGRRDGDGREAGGVGGRGPAGEGGVGGVADGEDMMCWERRAERAETRGFSGRRGTD